MADSTHEAAPPDRITVEALRFYVPLFQSGDRATELLKTDEDFSPQERHTLINQAKLKKLALDKISSLAGPLITKEINKIISKSHLKKHEETLFDLLYYASLNGLEKGLRRFEVDKIDVSATNYIFQWITTYAKKELSVVEAAPHGVAPSRFQRYKKISAVRKKLSEKLGYYASNEEVLVYFQSGQADLETMNGRKGSSGKASSVNRQMTLDLIEEQEEFEKNLFTQQLLDPLEDYRADSTLSMEDSIPFVETLFGYFLASHNFTPQARAAILSDLQAATLSQEEAKSIEALTLQEMKKLSSMWKELLRDVRGPFYSFLTRLDPDGFQEFDITGTRRHIEELQLSIKPARWLPLFINGKVEAKA